MGVKKVKDAYARRKGWEDFETGIISCPPQELSNHITNLMIGYGEAVVHQAKILPAHKIKLK